MGQFKFTKMHGLGNNYIYVNAFEEKLAEEQLADLAINVSNVHTGIGSDGLIFIAPSDQAPVKMRIFNNDGSEAKTCGNGLRCVAKYAYEHGLVRDKVFQIETLAGLVEAEIHETNGRVDVVTIDMGEPRLTRKQIPYSVGDENEMAIKETMNVNGQDVTFTGVSMGNPHGVIFVDRIEAAPVTTLGPLMEKDARFPDGVNVEFIEILNEREMNFRVWERGSGVTQACGTGACAAVVAAVLNGQMKKGETVTVHLEGGDLQIEWAENGRVWMTGPAETICDGVFYY